MSRERARAARFAFAVAIALGGVVAGDARAEGPDEPVLCFRAHEWGINKIAYTSDLIATASIDDTVRLWSASDGSFKRKLTTLYHGGADLTDVILWNRAMKNVTGVAFSPSRQEVASASFDGNVRIWSTETGKLRKRFRVHPYSETEVYDIAYSPRGDLVAVLVEAIERTEDKAIQIWSVENGKRTLSIGASKSYFAVAFSPDGKRIVAGNRDGSARVFAVEDGALKLTLPDHGGAVTSVAFSPEGGEIATGSQDGKLRFWSADDGKLLRTIDAGGVSCLAYSPCGDALASACRTEIRLWSVRDGTLARTLVVSKAHVGAIAFSPAGDRLAAAANASSCSPNPPHFGTVRVWKIDPLPRTPSPGGPGITSVVGGSP